jgi:hypothetical protein
MPVGTGGISGMSPAMGSTVIFLGEMAQWTDRLEVACRKCDRHGF